MVSIESGEFESITKTINCYELYPPEENDPTIKLKKGYGGIKIFDTPGLVKNKNLNSFDLIKNELNDIFNQIHFILFFIKGQGNLEDCIDMLRFIRNKNIERKKNNINEMPILFVKNGQDLKDNYVPKFFEYLKNFLKKNNLIELYDNTVNVKHNNNVEDEEDDNFFEENENLGDKYENYVDGNLIQVYIPTGKNINKLFSTIITSGTLTPIESMESELKNNFNIKLENNHVIADEQFFFSVLTKSKFNNINRLLWNLSPLGIGTIVSEVS